MDSRTHDINAINSGVYLADHRGDPVRKWKDYYSSIHINNTKLLPLYLRV